jgi:hypothetical protein
MGFYANNNRAAESALWFWNNDLAVRAGSLDVLEFLNAVEPYDGRSCLRLTDLGKIHQARVERFVNDNYSDCLHTGSGVAWADLRTRRVGRYRAMPTDHALEVLRQHNKSLSGTEFESLVKTEDDISTWSSVASTSRGSESLPFADLPCRASMQGSCRQMVYGTTDTLYRYQYNKNEIVLPFRNDDLDETDVEYIARWNPALNMAGHTVAMERSSHTYPLRIILPHDWSRKLVYDVFGTPDNATKVVESSNKNFLGVAFIRYTITPVDEAAEDYVTRPPRNVPPGSMFFPLLLFGPLKPEKDNNWADNALGWSAFRLFNYRGLMVDLGDYAPRKRVTYSEVRDVMCKLREPDGPWRMFMVRRDGEEDDYHLLVRPKSRDGDADEATAVIQKRLIPACFDWMDKPGFKAGIRVRGMEWSEKQRDGCHFDGNQKCEKTTEQLRSLNGYKQYKYSNGGGEGRHGSWRPLTALWMVMVMLFTAVTPR